MKKKGQKERGRVKGEEAGGKRKVGRIVGNIRAEKEGGRGVKE